MCPLVHFNLQDKSKQYYSLIFYCPPNYSSDQITIYKYEVEHIIHISEIPEKINKNF